MPHQASQERSPGFGEATRSDTRCSGDAQVRQTKDCVGRTTHLDRHCEGKMSSERPDAHREQIPLVDASFRRAHLKAPVRSAMQCSAVSPVSVTATMIRMTSARIVVCSAIIPTAPLSVWWTRMLQRRTAASTVCRDASSTTASLSGTRSSTCRMVDVKNEQSESAAWHRPKGQKGAVTGVPTARIY